MGVLDSEAKGPVDDHPLQQLQRMYTMKIILVQEIPGRI